MFTVVKFCRHRAAACWRRTGLGWAGLGWGGVGWVGLDGVVWGWKVREAPHRIELHALYINTTLSAERVSNQHNFVDLNKKKKENIFFCRFPRKSVEICIQFDNKPTTVLLLICKITVLDFFYYYYCTNFTLPLHHLPWQHVLEVDSMCGHYCVMRGQEGCMGAGMAVCKLLVITRNLLN